MGKKEVHVKTSMILRVIGAGYLIYCSISVYKYMGEHPPNEKVFLGLGAAVLFAAAIVILIHLLIVWRKEKSDS